MKMKNYFETKKLETGGKNPGKFFFFEINLKKNSNWKWSETERNILKQEKKMWN